MDPDAYLEMADNEEHHWWFSARRMILADIVAGFRLPPSARILEIGSGTGGNLEMLAGFGVVSALEMDETARSIASERTGGLFDIRAGCCPSDTPFVGEEFDLICLLDVLEHIDEDIATLIAAHRLLAEGGRVLITVPAHRWLWSDHDIHLHHKRRYSAAELRQKVTAAGLEPVRLTYFNTILFPLAAVLRLKDRWFGSSSASGARMPPAPVNRLLRGLFALERFLLGWTDLPFGVSLLCVVQSEGPRNGCP